MNLKRNLAVVFCMILMVSCLLIPASAASASNANIIVVADKSEVKAGDIVTFSVVLTNASATPEGIYSYDAKIAISGGLTLVEGSVKAVANDGFYAPTFTNNLRCTSTGYNAEGNGGKGYNKGNLTLGTFQCKVESKGTATVSSVVFTENGYSEKLDMVINVVTNGVGGSATVNVKHDHVWGEWTIEKAVTCEDDGLKVRYCACGERDEAVIPAIGHAWGEWKTEKAATCVDDGQEVRICANCGEKQSRTVSATGEHSWSAWTVKTAATCVADGKEIRTCSVCGEEETRTIPATGVHTWGNWIVDVEADCENEGSEHRICSVCGEKETKIVNALGHLPGDPVREEHYAATYDEDGCYDMVVYCTRCGDEISREHVRIPASGRDPIPDTGDFTVALGMVLIVVMMVPCLLVSKFRAVK